MNIRVDGIAWVGVCTDGPMYAQTHAHFFHVCGGWGCDFLSGAERERVSDFVDIVTFHCMYMSIVRYGLDYFV